MNTLTSRRKSIFERSAAQRVEENKSSRLTTSLIADNRQNAVAQQKILDNRSKGTQQKKSQAAMNGRSTNPSNEVLQGFFTNGVLAGYTAAQNYWTQARNAVNNFDTALDNAGYNHNDNAKTTLLNTNANLKANKARGTLAGESFETLHWDAGAAPNVEGPGGANGIDILTYDLTGAAGELDTREVKSAMDQNSAFSVIGTAWRANPIILSEVELYYQGNAADFNVGNLPVDPNNAAFSRAGDDYYRVGGPVRDLTVRVRNPANGGLLHTVYFDIF